MTHQHNCGCKDCRRLWGDPKKRMKKFLRRLDAGELTRARDESQEVYELDGKTIVVLKLDCPEACLCS